VENLFLFPLPLPACLISDLSKVCVFFLGCRRFCIGGGLYFLQSVTNVISRLSSSFCLVDLDLLIIALVYWQPQIILLF